MHKDIRTGETKKLIKYSTIIIKQFIEYNYNMEYYETLNK